MCFSGLPIIDIDQILRTRAHDDHSIVEGFQDDKLAFVAERCLEPDPTARRSVVLVCLARPVIDRNIHEEIQRVRRGLEGRFPFETPRLDGVEEVVCTVGMPRRP